MTNRAYAKSNGDGLLCSILCLYEALPLNSICPILKASVHYGSFYDHSMNFASVNYRFSRICKRCLWEVTQC